MERHSRRSCCGIPHSGGAALEIGDQVTTIGGVIGRVVAIKDDTFVLETGADRVKIRFTKNAISSVEKLNMDNAPANAKK